MQFSNANTKYNSQNVIYKTSTSLILQHKIKHFMSIKAFFLFVFLFPKRPFLPIKSNLILSCLRSFLYQYFIQIFLKLPKRGLKQQGKKMKYPFVGTL